uniref:Uncharacterized protein n=1 Tax=Anguilla anguilla TaxID=7936 RepID=A0A0E9U859_ANGAN
MGDPRHSQASWEM